MARITLAEAEKMLEAAKAKINELGVNMGVSIVDGRGDLIAMFRTDGASWRTPYLSQGKAVASATFGQSSNDLSQRATAPIFQAMMSMQGGRFIPGQGALPIFKDGELVGAAGASGGTSQQDEDVVRAGIQAAGLKESA